MWAANAFGELTEERIYDFFELLGLNYIQDFFHFSQKHNFLKKGFDGLNCASRWRFANEPCCYTCEAKI